MVHPLRDLCHERDGLVEELLANDFAIEVKCNDIDIRDIEAREVSMNCRGAIIDRLQPHAADLTTFLP